LVVWRKKGAKVLWRFYPKAEDHREYLAENTDVCKKTNLVLDNLYKAILFFKALETLEGIVLFLKLKKVL
jgi:hypothetical protein